MFCFIVIAAIMIAVLWMQGALVLWALSLFGYFTDWTNPQALGVGLLLSIASGVFGRAVTKGGGE